ncbi:DUF192 domain-containing protein [Sphingosinicella rhizophila]|uniref:DUF192 domain-containing protein n=1 Tax=Sphingosinicella rhizophila TaxID=3050082 RepID=A0ABU3Q4M0_9SPHN|nr:DUF192 domain-containing protein [Sphingosinicella sp. GR2756]MDT9598370.1 DUF192 domain-containing protein [Sphingosinicella sp. GR2756]
MILNRLFLAILLATGAHGCRAETQNVASPSAAIAPSGLDVVTLEVRGSDSSHAFRVEIARTPEEQEKGMMFRDSMGADDGMIFPFPSPRPARFWMKNTMIPLDLIFIREDGTIARIAVNAEPYSLAGIESGEPVAAVLEIAGGRSVELGIVEGDRVVWPGGPVG